jgi:hypothetical protein
VLAMADSTRDLVQVDGTASDTVNLIGAWVLGAAEGGYEYYSMTGVDVTLKIADAIVVVLPVPD